MRIKHTILFFLLLVLQISFGQQKLKPSVPEKCWALLHPLKVKKAIKVTRKVQTVVDSLATADVLGSNVTGNRLDAFKHAYWMYCLAKDIGCNAAKSLGKAHEKGNYQFYKKQKKKMACCLMK